MDSGANLRDTSTIMAAKAILVAASRGFATAIEEAQSDAERFGMWLDSEGPSHWERQRRLRTEKLNEDRSALARKQMQPTADGRPPSTIDERKTVARSEESVRRAEDCLRQLRKWSIEYQRVLALFRAGLGPLSTFVDQIVPSGIASLNRMAQAIDAYLALSQGKSDITDALNAESQRRSGSQTLSSDASSQDALESMRRAPTPAPPTPQEPADE